MARITQEERRLGSATLEDLGPPPGAFDADRMVDEFIVLAEWIRGREDTGCVR